MHIIEQMGDRVVQQTWDEPGGMVYTVEVDAEVVWRRVVGWGGRRAQQRREQVAREQEREAERHV